jgi:FAD/FMN-containing dehydrogenase
MAAATAIVPMLDPSAVAEFVGTLRGAVIQPDDPTYDETRSVRNGLIDRCPALIVRCSGTADVVAAVTFARENDLLLSIRGGSHNVSGAATNDGGIVIDLSTMRGVRVDPTARTVRVQGGATWGDVDRETQLFGLATPGGVVSTTGVGGLTLHGGWGWLRRKFGYCVDNLVSVDIVTADGQVRTASETENQDLFWAVRGAGSNFGVVTSFTFRLHQVGPTVMLCAPMYALADAPAVLPKWRDFIATAPDEFTPFAVFWSVPEGFPPELVGAPIVILAGVYAGPVEEGERLVRPLRELATPLLDLSGPMPFAAVQSAFDPFFPKGMRQYWKST